MKTNTNLKALCKDIFLYGLMEGLAKSMSFLLLPVFTRVFSPPEYGIIEIMVILINIFTATAALALPMSVARHFHAYESAEDVRNHVLTALLTTAAFSALLMFTCVIWAQQIAALLTSDPANGNYVILCAGAGSFTALAGIPLMVLRMERRIITFNLLSLVYSVLYAGTALLFVFVFERSLLGVFQALLLASAAQFALSIPSTLKHMKGSFSWHHFKESISFSLPLMPTNSLTWLSQQIDRLVLLAYLGSAAVGIFGAAAKLSVIITVGTMVFRKAWIPFALKLVNDPGEERIDFYRVALNYYASIFAILGLGMTALSPELLSILVPAAYQQGFIVVPWIIGSGILQGSAALTQIGTLLEKRTYANLIASVIGTIINLGVALALIPIFGLPGAAIGAFISQLIFSGILWKLSSIYSNVRFDKGIVFIILITYIFSAASMLGLAILIEDQVLSLMLRLGLLLLVSILLGVRSLDRESLSKLLKMRQTP